MYRLCPYFHRLALALLGAGNLDIRLLSCQVVVSNHEVSAIRRSTDQRVLLIILRMGAWFVCHAGLVPALRAVRFPPNLSHKVVFINTSADSRHFKITSHLWHVGGYEDSMPENGRIHAADCVASCLLPYCGRSAPCRKFRTFDVRTRQSETWRRDGTQS